MLEILSLVRLFGIDLLIDLLPPETEQAEALLRVFVIFGLEISRYVLAQLRDDLRRALHVQVGLPFDFDEHAHAL